jgi:hypothetical protein
MSGENLTISKIGALRAKANAFKSILASTSPSEKTKLTTTTLAENFNRLLADVVETFPAVADAMPKPVSASHPIFDSRSEVHHLGRVW